MRRVRSPRGWKALMGDGESIDRRLYETAVMATLRDRLRSGDLWIDGSRNYRRFDAYLLPRSEVPAAAAVLRLPATGEAYIASGPGGWTGGCAGSPARSGVVQSKTSRSGTASSGSRPCRPTFRLRRRGWTRS